MHIIRFFSFFLIVIYFSTGLAKAQSNSSFLTFDQFFQNYSMFNPASPDSSDKFLVRVGHSSLQGLFAGVNRMYFDADYKPGKKNATSYSRLGLLIRSNNDGPYINRSSYYGRYSRTLALGNDQYLSLGIALGGVTISLKGSQYIGGGNSTAFDGYTGIWYQQNKLKVGVSLEQVTQSILTPIQQSFKLNPILNLNVIYASYLNPHILLTNHLYFRKEKSLPASFEYAPILLFSQVIEAGTNFKFGRGIAIMFGVRTHTIGYGKISFMGSFLIGTRQLSTSADNKFEITARYFL